MIYYGERYYNAIISIVCEHHNISQIEFMENTNRRDRKYSEPRQEVMYFLKLFTQLPLAEIGARVGKDHATVIHSARLIKNLKQTDKKYCDTLDDIEQKIGFRLNYLINNPISDEKEEAKHKGVEHLSTSRCNVQRSVDNDKWHLVITSKYSNPSFRDVFQARAMYLPKDIDVVINVPINIESLTVYAIELWEKV